MGEVGHLQLGSVEGTSDSGTRTVSRRDANAGGVAHDDNNEKQPELSLPFYKLFSFADKYDLFLMVLGTVGAVIHGSAMPIFFMLFGDLINGFGKNQGNPAKMMNEVSKFALNFVYLGLVVLVSSWAEIACWIHTGERQVGKWRKKYLEAVLKQDVGFFDTDSGTGDIVFSISTDTLLVQDAISEKVGNFIHYLSTFVAGLVVGFVSAWRLALLSIAVIPGIAFGGGLYAYTVTGLTSKSHKAYANAGNIAEQAIAQIRTVYSFVGEERALNSYSEALQTTQDLGYKGGMAKGLGIGCTYGIAFMSWALVFWYAGVFIRNGQTDGGKAFTAIFSAIVGGLSLGQSISNIAAFGKGKVSGYKLIEIIKQQPTIIHDVSEGKKLTEIQGSIKFQDVTFSYPCRPDVLIFRKFSLQIPPGKTLAIVGGSGSGKSTVVALIERFYDPIEGHVYLDGHDLKTLQLKWLRQQIGLVNQEPALFATTIRENILYGKEDATMEEVEEAANAANAHSFITVLPNGYDTQVGERGVQLSGGQKQRIAIVRAMLKNPKILLLDEATSALDAGCESIVQEALDRLMIGRTTVVVAHRLSTIRNADTIAVLQKGQLVELGNHEELLAKGSCGAYSALVRLQEMAMTKDGSLPLRKSKSTRLSHSLSTKSLSLRSGSLRALTYQYSTGADGSLEMISNADANKINPPPQGSLFRLLKLNAPEWPYALLGAAGSILSGLISPSFAIVMSNMLEVFYYTDDKEMESKIRTYVFFYIGAGLYAIVAYLTQHYFFGIVGENLTTRVRKMMLAAILRNEVSWFDEDENNSSQIASRLAADATNVKSAIAERISVILQNMTSLLTSFIVAFIVEWRMALLILATFPLLVLANFVQQLSLKGFAGDTAKAHARASMVAGEAVSNIRTVAAFNAEDKVLNLFGKELKLPQAQSFKRGLISGSLFGFSQLSLYGSEALILWYGSRLVQNRTSTFSKVIKVFVVLVITANSVAETLSLAPDFVRGGEALSSIFAILDRGTKIEPDDEDAEKVEETKGEIELKHIEFAYPSRPEVTIFKDLNLRIKAGRSQALVGASGSGKSSVIALIERFYDPIAGKVTIDGRDIKKLNLKSLRLNIGLVQQEPALFATTIYGNILYGRETANETEIVEAAKAANAHSFISSLPDGYQTMVGERGIQLSGGQKQRIAIARAVVKNPGLLLLDEATSALDAESESIVQEALERLMQGRTTVVVAHRLSTICNVDSIAVVQDGRMVEQGSHQELLTSGGPYSRLLNLQRNNA